jgi:hypothetical protein
MSKYDLENSMIKLDQVLNGTVTSRYCWCLVTLAVVEGSYHLSRSGGSSLVSVGTTSLECSVLKCGQATQRTIHLTTVQDATFQTGSTHADKTAPPAPPEMVWPPLPRLKLRGTNSRWSTAKWFTVPRHPNLVNSGIKLRYAHEWRLN